MKITLPRLSITAGCADPSDLTFQTGRLAYYGKPVGRAFFLSVGKPYLAAIFTLKTYEKDFRIVDRLRALVGIFALALAFVFACLVPVPIFLLGLLLGRLSNVAEFIADKIVKPFVEFAIPVPVYGIRNTFKTLFRVVTR